MAYKKYPMAKRGRKLRKRVHKKSTKPSRAFVKKVQQIVHKDVETKMAYNTLDLTAFNSGINSAGDAIQILPNIGQGTADHQRIGDQLRGQRLRVKGHMLATFNIPNTLANARVAVRIMVVQPRYIANYAQVVAQYSTWMSTLLKKGGTTSNFNGNIADLYAPINTDAIIKYYDKVVYLPTPQVYVGTGSTSVNTIVSCDVAKSCKFFNFTIPTRNKLIKYDSTISSQNPTNFAPVFLLGYAHLDGTAPDVLTTQVSCAYDAIFEYEDA